MHAAPTITVESIRFSEAGRLPDAPPLIARHYRRWLMQRLRVGVMPRDYEVWVASGDTFRRFNDADKAAVNWDEHDAEMRGQQWFMYRDSIPFDATRPWIVINHEGTIVGRYATPHEADNVIARLILKG